MSRLADKLSFANNGSTVQMFFKLSQNLNRKTQLKQTYKKSTVDSVLFLCVNRQEMITYHKEEVDFKLPDEAKLSEWLTNISSEEGSVISSLSYIFCSDEYLLQMNKDYLNHDYYTDIITFPLEEDPISADIFVSIDRVADNAKNFDIPEERELYRVMFHGLLHLLGFDDKTEDDQQAMRAKEEECLELIL